MLQELKREWNRKERPVPVSGTRLKVTHDDSRIISHTEPFNSHEVKLTRGDFRSTDEFRSTQHESRRLPRRKKP